MQWYWWLLELSANLVEAIMLVVFIQQFSEPRFKRQWPVIAAVFVIFIMITVNNRLTAPSAAGATAVNTTLFSVCLSMALYIGAGVAVSFLIYKGSLISRILLPIIILAFIIITEEFSMIILQSLFTTIDFTKDTQSRMFGIIISKVLLIMLVYFTGRFSKEKISNIPLGYSLSLLLVPIISIISVLTLGQYTFKSSSLSFSPVWFASTSAGILFLNLLIIYLFEALMNYGRKQSQLQLMVQQADMLNKHLRETNALQDETQRIWHDMKNHFTVIQWMVNSHNYEKLEQYMQTLNETVAASMPQYQSGNHILDALLNSKAVEAKNNGIELVVNAAIPSKLPVEDLDLNIVFSNALDNAIEACKKLPGDKERYIEFNAGMKNDHLVMTVKNPFAGHIRKNGDVLQSTKHEAGRHGIGIGNMKRAVEKYDGHIMSDYDNNIFTLTAIMCCKG
jgi:sensor histidine kinase YesM